MEILNCSSQNLNKSEILRDPWEVIYVGSPGKMVNFTYVDAKKLVYSRDLFINKQTNQTVNSALLYKFPLRHLGAGYENFYMVAMPCNDIVCKKPESEYEECKHQNLKDILDFPMVKINKHLQGDFIGFQSGCRSAIVEFNGKFYRLKGCGNQDKGFNQREMGFPKGGIDVRGCQFHHTAYREIYMSDIIAEKIKPFKVSNKPVGIWLYSNIENLDKGLADPIKKIDKFCSIYKIHSERRLGCGLFPGLEIILFESILYLLDNINKDNDDLKKLILSTTKLFHDKRIVSDNQQELIVEPTTSYVPMVNLEPGDNLNSLFTKYKIYQNLDDDTHQMISKTISSEEKKYHPFLSGLTEDFLKNILQNYFEKKGIYKLFEEKVNSSSREIIDKKIETFIKIIKNFKQSGNAYTQNYFDLIELIYCRIGWESGRLKRIMQDADINWGTYEDQRMRLHCNAHTDNYSINKRGSEEYILSILDFDMAFMKDNFFHFEDVNNPNYGLPDNFQFDSYLNMERQYLEWEFSGSENVLSFDFYKQQSEDKNFDFLSKAIFYKLRDAAVLSFRQGYLKVGFAQEKEFKQLYEPLYDLIDFALLISHDFMDKPF
jgi:hypothetical protein